MHFNLTQLGEAERIRDQTELCSPNHATGKTNAITKQHAIIVCEYRNNIEQ